MNSCCFICIFAVLINTVCLQVTVEGFIGASVLLPCSSAKHDLKLQDIYVHWRYNDIKIVFDIIPHSTSPVTQDPEYKNRTESFPQEYLRGNFSIKLINLQHTDAGKYICYITHSNDLQTVRLIINESVSTDPENQGETEQEGTGLSLPVRLVCIILPVILIIVVIILTFVFLKKRSISHKADGNSMVQARNNVVSPNTQYNPAETDNREEAVDK